MDVPRIRDFILLIFRFFPQTFMIQQIFSKLQAIGLKIIKMILIIFKKNEISDVRSTCLILSIVIKIEILSNCVSHESGPSNNGRCERHKASRVEEYPNL